MSDIELKWLGQVLLEPYTTQVSDSAKDPVAAALWY